MRRRTVLVVSGAGLSGLAGCLGDVTDAPSGSTTATEPPPATSAANPSRTAAVAATPSEDAFRSVVEDVADRVVEFSTTGDVWHIEYHFDICCGEGFETHQSAIARNFSHLRPGNVTLTARVHHECQVVEWQVPASLASAYDRGEVESAEFIGRVLNTTERTDAC